MTTVILSAASASLPSLHALEALVRAELAQKGETAIRTFALAEVELAYCQGDFDCWIKTPGVCRSHDAEAEIVRAIHDADRLVLIDAVTYGGHGADVKRAQDRLLALLMPYFKKSASLTHHESRYAKPASLFALGWMPAVDAEEAKTWCELADANAINLHAPVIGAVVVDDAHRDAWAAEVCAMLTSVAHPGENIHARGPLRDALIAAARPDAPLAVAGHARTAAILVGSAKPRGTSTSETVARALVARLTVEGVAATLHFASDFVHDATGRAAASEIAPAELFVLVTPLYVDAFPALVIRALDAVRAARIGTGGRFVAIVNCGFPEPEHTRTAMRIARHFAAHAGYTWSGGLPLGGGEIVRTELPLDDQRGPVDHVRHALDAAALALAAGGVVPAVALEAMMVAPMPDVIYRIAGNFGWRYQAHEHGLANRELDARPLD